MKDLRDDIALRAMDALIIQGDVGKKTSTDPLGQRTVGREAYRIADDMLRARGEQRPVKPPIGWISTGHAWPVHDEDVLAWVDGAPLVARWLATSSGTRAWLLSVPGRPWLAGQVTHWKPIGDAPKVAP